MSNRCFIVRSRRILLLRRSIHNKRGVGEYELPGGKIDDRLEIKSELLREVFEETGFKVRLVKSLGYRFSEDVMRKRRTPTPHVSMYWLSRIEQGTLALSDEHDHAVWCTYKEALQLTLSQRTIDSLRAYRTALKDFGLQMS